jgi:Flp pilus assembly protein TadD
MTSLYDRFRWAQALFELRDYRGAATTLEGVLAEAGDVRHGLDDARLLLARAYFHSAQLGRAEEVARGILEDEPEHDYAALLLGRTLQRVGRHEEARRYLTRAAVLGAPGLDDPAAGS